MSEFGSLDSQTISDRVIISHCQLRKRNAKRHKILSLAFTKIHNPKHAPNANKDVDKDVAPTSAAKDEKVIADKSIEDLE